MGDWFSAKQQEQPSKNDARPAPPTQYDPHFVGRRSPVLAKHGMVASSQPLASQIGLQFLKEGANAAEAAIAMAAALCVTEPCSTGLGGDMFGLYYQASTKEVHAINGSGQSPASLTLEKVQTDCGDGTTVDSDRFMFSALAVTLPGAARGWEDLLKRHGSGKYTTLAQLVEPAAKLAEEGFPVAPITARQWKSGLSQLSKWVTSGENIPLTIDGNEAPKAGQLFYNPDLAKVLRELGAKGATAGFYEGTTGQAIVDAVQRHGGVLTLDDLKQHTSTFPDAISANYRNVKLWQVPPNGQGIAGLIALSGLNHLEQHADHCPRITPETIHSANAYHVQMEMTRLGFHDARRYVADPGHLSASRLEWLLDPKRIGKRAADLFDPTKAVVAGAPLPSSDTVSFQVVDAEGNAISFVNSNFVGFGTGIVPDHCGFTLQNRGFGFTVDDPSHPNVLAPSKRPYHTIIPGMITYADTNELHSTISNMGGNMQPQGHLQLTVDMVAGGLDPQAAIDKPRFCISSGTKEGMVQLEQGVHPDEVNELLKRGHDLEYGLTGLDRGVVGKAQIIKKDRDNGVLWGGSDGRGDGCAMGY